MTRLKWLLAILILAGLVLIGLRAKAETVSSAIVMLVDYSSSMVGAERAWQRDGLAAVFGDPSIEDRIARTRREAVAVTVVAFAGRQRVVIPWMILREGDGSVALFRAAVAALPRNPREVGDGTNIAQAILFAGSLLEGWDADRLIIDIQTDGTQGEAPQSDAAIANLEAARDALPGVVLNVLIMGQPQSSVDLSEYHWRHTATGLVWEATTPEAYLKALQTKIYLELG